MMMGPLSGRRRVCRFVLSMAAFWCRYLRICTIAAEPSMMAINLAFPPQDSQVSISILNTRLRFCIQVMARCGGTLLATPQRAGALFALSCIKTHLFGATQPRLFRLAEKIGLAAGILNIGSTGPNNSQFRQSGK